MLAKKIQRILALLIKATHLRIEPLDLHQRVILLLEVLKLSITYKEALKKMSSKRKTPYLKR